MKVRCPIMHIQCYKMSVCGTKRKLSKINLHDLCLLNLQIGFDPHDLTEKSDGDYYLVFPDRIRLFPEHQAQFAYYL